MKDGREAVFLNVLTQSRPRNAPTRGMEMYEYVHLWGVHPDLGMVCLQGEGTKTLIPDRALAADH